MYCWLLIVRCFFYAISSRNLLEKDHYLEVFKFEVCVMETDISAECSQGDIGYLR